MQIWDFDDSVKRIVTSSYFRAANAILLVFSLFSKESCDKLHLWIKELKTSFLNEKATRYIIGHRFYSSATEPERVLSTESAEEIAKEAGFYYWEAEAKTGKNVEDLFSNLVRTSKQKASGFFFKRGHGRSEGRGDGAAGSSSPI